MKIHGGLWVGLAILIWLYTTFIQARTDQDIPLFRWVAVLFIIWGAFRIYQDHPFGKKRKKHAVGPPTMDVSGETYNTHGSPYQSHGHIRHPQGSPYQSHQHTRPHQHVSGSHSIVRCPHCHKTMSARAHFCPSCSVKR